MDKFVQKPAATKQTKKPSEKKTKQKAVAILDFDEDDYVENQASKPMDTKDYAKQVPKRQSNACFEELKKKRFEV
jgi:hypothetical protein